MIVLLAAVGLYIAALLVTLWIALRPWRIPLFLSPGSLGTTQERAEFPGPLGLLKGWWVPCEDPSCVVVLAHGYYLNRAEMSPAALFLWQAGAACLLFDFRAHGSSAGKVTSLGWREREDVMAAVRHARERYPNKPIVLMGSSMGAAASALAVGDNPQTVDALILDSCYANMDDAAAGWWRFLGGKKLMLVMTPLRWLAPLVFGFRPRSVDVARCLAQLKTPTLLLHGNRDLIVPLDQAERNAAAGPHVRLVVFENCDHSEARWIHPHRYLAEVQGFLEAQGLLTPRKTGTL